MTVEAESVIKPGDDLRVGDCVELVGEVVEFKPNMTTIRFRAAPLVSDRDLPNGVVLAGRRVERPLAIGDRVKCRGFDGCQILALDGENVWLKWRPGSRSTEFLSDLERAKDDKEC